MKRALTTLVLAAGIAVSAPAVASAAPVPAPAVASAGSASVAAALPGPGRYGCRYQTTSGQWVIDTGCWAWGLRLRLHW